MKQKYLDIIDMPHHVSTVHKPMSLLNRATQFAPFAALVGYDEYIKTRGIDTDVMPDIYQDKEEAINVILNKLKKGDSINIVYYRDKLIRYLNGVVSQIDIINQKIIFKNKQVILFNEIVDIYEDDN